MNNFQASYESLYKSYLNEENIETSDYATTTTVIMQVLIFKLSICHISFVYNPNALFGVVVSASELQIKPLQEILQPNGEQSTRSCTLM